MEKISTSKTISKKKIENELHFQLPKVGKVYLKFSMCCLTYKNSCLSSMALLDLIINLLF